MPQIQVFRCPSCGASLSYEGGPEINITCQFCGTNVVVPQELRAQAAPPPAMPPLVPDAAGTAADIKQAGMEAVEQLVTAGKKIEAIKVYRMVTGVGLKEAKDAVEAMEAGGGQQFGAVSAPTNQTDMAMVEQLARVGQKLEAIKAYRQMTGVGLREAVDAVEALTRGRKLSSNTLSGPVARPAPKKRESNAGCFGCVLMLAGLVAGFYFLFFYLPIRLSGAYGATLAAARSNPDIVEALGRPIEADWWLWVTRWSCNVGCSARYTLGLHGPRASGTVAVFATMRSGGNFFDPAAWSARGTVTTKAGGAYDLSGRSTTSSPQPTAAPMATAAPRPTAVRETPTPNMDATAEVMQQTQGSWQSTRPITLAESFKDWPIGTKQDDAIVVTTTAQAKTYTWTVFPRHSSSYMNFTPAEAVQVEDFVAMVDLKFVSGAAGNTYAYGLIFRLVNDDYGFFGLQNDGQFRLLLVEATGIYEKVQKTSSAIRTGPGSSNHLEVHNLGSDFVFQINGERVWLLHHELTPGAVGLGVDVYVKGKPAEVQFSKFDVLVPSP